MRKALLKNWAQIKMPFSSSGFIDSLHWTAHSHGIFRSHFRVVHFPPAHFKPTYNLHLLTFSFQYLPSLDMNLHSPIQSQSAML